MSFSIGGEKGAEKKRRGKRGALSSRIFSCFDEYKKKGEKNKREMQRFLSFVWLKYGNYPFRRSSNFWGYSKLLFTSISIKLTALVCFAVG